MSDNINNSNSTMNEHETSTNVLSIEVFLNERYLFRHNVLNGKTEFAKKLEDGTVTEYRVLTQKALNSILIQAKREDVFEEGGSKSDIQEYMEVKDIAELVEICFRKPKEGERVKALSCKEMLKVIKSKYTSLEINHKTKVHLANAMKELGYESKEYHHSAQYYAIPLAA